MEHPEITRRAMLGSAGVATAWMAGATPGRAQPQSFTWNALGPESLSSPPPPSPEIHLLNRISFGPTPESVERVAQLGLEGFIDEQLDPETLDDAETEAAVATLFPTLAMSAAELADPEKRVEVIAELKAATLLRAASSRRQLFEVMVDFWSNHFNIFHLDGACSFLKTIDDREVIRPHALGRFRDLLTASAKSPAMLFYLDNYVNRKDGPNENYARELMELHTLGVDGGFVHQDIDEVARCFTGWGIVRRQGTFGFFARDHDTGPKTVLGIDIPAGGGVEDGEKVLEILAEHPATAQHVSWKLCRHFVADQPPAALVDEVAATFTQTDGDLREVMRTLLGSDAFFAAADHKLKRPLEWVVATARALRVEFRAQAGRSLGEVLRTLGQLPFDWPAPDGYPDVAAAWLNTNGLLNRWNFGLAVGANALPGLRVDLAGLLADAASTRATDLVDAAIRAVLRRAVVDRHRDRLVAYLADGQPATAPLGSVHLERQLPGLIALLLDSPYFQWR